MKTGIELISEERKRQLEHFNWDAKNDDQYVNGELASAGVVYAMPDTDVEFLDDKIGNDAYLYLFPFDLKWLKKNKESRIRDLQKAGAFMAAEIDRLKRLEQ